MAKSVNLVVLLGNVGADPEIKTLQNDVKLAKFSMATSFEYKKKDGENVSRTQWHTVVVWRQLAEIVEKYVTKGMQVFVKGRIEYEKYEKDGETKYFTTIQADDVTFCGTANEARGEAHAAAPQQKQAATLPDDDDNDLPF